MDELYNVAEAINDLRSTNPNEPQVRVCEAQGRLMADYLHEHFDATEFQTVSDALIVASGMLGAVCSALRMSVAVAAPINMIAFAGWYTAPGGGR